MPGWGLAEEGKDVSRGPQKHGDRVILNDENPNRGQSVKDVMRLVVVVNRWDGDVFVIKQC